jgi:hypothetical protein
MQAKRTCRGEPAWNAVTAFDNVGQARKRLSGVPRILPARFWIESDTSASTVVAKFTVFETVGKPCGLLIFHDCRVPESADDFT